MNPYVVFLLYLAAILGFVAVTLLLNRLLGPKPAASAIKLGPFECGATPVDTLNVKAVPIRYVQATYNYVLRDPGAAYHNGRYTLQLLYDSLESLGASGKAGVDMRGKSRP